MVSVPKLYLEEEEISILPCLHPAVVRKGSDVDSWVLIVTVETNGWFPRQGQVWTELSGTTLLTLLTLAQSSHHNTKTRHFLICHHHTPPSLSLSHST